MKQDLPKEMGQNPKLKYKTAPGSWLRHQRWGQLGSINNMPPGGLAKDELSQASPFTTNGRKINEKTWKAASEPFSPAVCMLPGPVQRGRSLRFIQLPGEQLYKWNRPFSPSYSQNWCAICSKRGHAWLTENTDSDTKQRIGLWIRKRVVGERNLHHPIKIPSPPSLLEDQTQHWVGLISHPGCDPHSSDTDEITSSELSWVILVIWIGISQICDLRDSKLEKALLSAPLPEPRYRWEKSSRLAKLNGKQTS